MTCEFCGRDVADGSKKCSFCGHVFVNTKEAVILEGGKKDDTELDLSKKTSRYIGNKYAAIVSLILGTLSFLVPFSGVPAFILGLMGFNTKLRVMAVIGGVLGLLTSLWYLIAIILITTGIWIPEFLGFVE
jgi:hypothetical protein